MSSSETLATKDSNPSPITDSTTPATDRTEDRQARFKALQARAVGNPSEVFTRPPYSDKFIRRSPLSAISKKQLRSHNGLQRIQIYYPHCPGNKPSHLTTYSRQILMLPEKILKGSGHGIGPSRNPRNGTREWRRNQSTVMT